VGHAIRPLRWAIVLAALLVAAGAPVARAQQERPNVIVVMTDDQRLWDMEAMPQTNRLLGDAGTTFANAFSTYPLCCPSRATFLSGQYEHNHGVIDNDAPDGGYGKFDFSNALGVWLQAAGYRTAHVGKQLNEYGVALQPTQDAVPPGYDDWFALRDPLTYQMYNYVVQDNDLRRPYGALPADYQTDVLADRAVENIRRWAPDARPFFMHFAPSAVHWEFTDAEAGPRPAPRHEGAFADHGSHRRPNYDEADVSDKPSVMRRYERLDPELQRKIDDAHRTRLAALLSVDEAVARIVRELEQAGELDRTVIVFTSDNGYLHGEHRFPSEKVVPYEESVRVPLLIRGPGFPAGALRSQLVGNIDLAPTIVELAGAGAGRPMDGESLLPFARAADHRGTRSLVLEADFAQLTGQHEVVIPEYHRGVNVYYDAIRTGRYKYVHWFRDVNGDPADEEELYDLEVDPFELQSLHASERHAGVKAALARELAGFKDCRGEDCRRSFAEPPPPCLAGPPRVRRPSIGPLRLGLGRAELLRRAGSPRRAGTRAWRWCVRPRGTAYLALSERGRTRLVATTAPTRGARGLARGASMARLRRAYPNARRVAPGLFSAGRRSAVVLGVKRGKVRFVGLADTGLRRDARALARHVRLAGL
jgi:arylsulfatase A-like enzyme